jgi:predicted enzyme related to lactoylglutathione lyase
MLNFNSLIIFSENPQALVDFYKKVFNADPGWSDNGYSGFQLGSGHIVFGPHSEVHGKNANPERQMFFLETKDVKGEFERIKALGAKVIKEPNNPEEEKKGDGPDIATFADPDNNYFQLASPMKP